MTTRTPVFEVELTRVIDAPRARIYEAWTKPEQVAQWFAPKPFQLIVEQMDFRAGGRFRMAMRGPDGEDFPFTGTYRDIVPPKRLGWAGEFTSGPSEQITTEVIFTEQSGKTAVHVRQSFWVMTAEIGHATKGARQGWTTTLDQLAEFCAGGAPGGRIERKTSLDAPVSRVWRALTDHHEFGEWFGVSLDGPFAVGEVSRGHMTEPGYEDVKWEAVVEKLEPESLFSYTWHPYAVDPKKDYSKESPTRVEFRLKKAKHGTQLTVTESGFDRITQERRAEAFRMHVEGWAMQMKNIAAHLARGR